MPTIILKLENVEDHEALDVVVMALAEYAEHRTPVATYVSNRYDHHGPEFRGRKLKSVEAKVRSVHGCTVEVYSMANVDFSPIEARVVLRQRDDLALALASALEIIGPISGSEGSPLDDEILRLKKVLEENA